ncbi:hypothetical protein FIBSPDRAFT_962181 [Athelia psychrophila]|uniref:Uncharacterized protein n=1 Tax=Athelia psychrophila TaxID=1759441 RepID=A0A166AEI5_9AGAM|nr:hypothetical protein FIBSPDRAFT_962181 [Fibularhizoctonia sp. CBS 109695]
MADSHHIEPLDEADMDGFSAVMHINVWGNFALDRLARPCREPQCPMCREFPRDSTVTVYDYVSCEPCITNAFSRRYKCPV